MSREGSGRVAVLKATGLVRSYTLECNYNTGRLVNPLPPTARDGPNAPALNPPTVTPPKYTPHIFEEVSEVTHARKFNTYALGGLDGLFSNSALRILGLFKWRHVLRVDFIVHLKFAVISSTTIVHFGSIHRYTELAVH